MLALPWKTFREAEQGREYLVLLTELPLHSYWAVPRLLRVTRLVQQSLSSAPGLLGYSLLARPLRKQFWILSVWEHETDLMAFVRGIPNRAVMAAFQPHMGPTRCVQWGIHGNQYPPTWDEAFARAVQHAPGRTPSPP